VSFALARRACCDPVREHHELRRTLGGEVMAVFFPPAQEQVCPLCHRPSYRSSRHHLVPQCRGGKEKLKVCVDCHRAVHATFSNKEIESRYNTVEALLAHEGFAKMVAFISKQDGRVRVRLSHNQRRRGRNG